MSLPSPIDFMNLAQQFVGQLKTTFSSVKSASSFLAVIGMIVIIGKCIFSFINFFISFLIWQFKDFILWLFTPFPTGLFSFKRGDEKMKAGLLPWLIRYIIVIAYKVIRLPKCFLWYFLDTAGWILYLPFRFTFWFMDWLMGGKQIVKAEHKAWDTLNQLDYFLHGRPNDNFFMFQYDPNPAPKLDKNGHDVDTMKLGLHIIHFPDSVMFQCYSLSPYKLAKFPPFPMKQLSAFLKCAISPF
jgi:hypothetical protein